MERVSKNKVSYRYSLISMFAVLLFLALPVVSGAELVKGGALDLGPDGLANPGDVINYSFAVTNTEVVTLLLVIVSDPMAAPITCPSGNPMPSLASAATETCTGSYIITQADIDAGSVVNTALASGFDPAGLQIPYSDTLTTPIPVAVPTLSELGLIVLVILICLGAIYFIRRKRVV